MYTNYIQTFVNGFDIFGHCSGSATVPQFDFIDHHFDFPTQVPTYICLIISYLNSNNSNFK